MSTEPVNTNPAPDAASEVNPEVSTVSLVTGEAVDEAAETDEVNAEPEPLTPEQMDRYECRCCGYTYEPVKGDNQSKIPAGIAFE